MAHNDTTRQFNISFDPSSIIKDAEKRMMNEFQQATEKQIRAFCSSDTVWKGNERVEIPGAGLLLIREFLEKKFDDPKTQERLGKFFEENFDRIMGEVMEKAIQHKVNAFVFARTKQEATPEKMEEILARLNGPKQ